MTGARKDRCGLGCDDGAAVVIAGAVVGAGLGHGCADGAAVIIAAAGVGSGFDGAVAFDALTISVSKQDTKISSVYLQIHNHRNVTGPAGMSAGNFTVSG